MIVLGNAAFRMARGRKRPASLPPSGDWILLGGIWNDGAMWLDDQAWID